jgi:AcrR family transcriptional regulator
MSLFEEHKAERRTRILAAAREIIAERGYDGLTMRDLARAARVSVPTLYNLFGGKRALLAGELEENFATVVAAMRAARGASFVARTFTGCEVSNAALLASPGFSRVVVQLFLGSEETRPLRRSVSERYVAMMADHVRDAQSSGEIVPWIDAEALARSAYGHYVQTMVEWALGDLDDATFRTATLYGQALLLLGVARGRARAAVERRLRQLQEASSGPPRPRRARAPRD